jgi:hypothetical protein
MLKAEACLPFKEANRKERADADYSAGTLEWLLWKSQRLEEVSSQLCDNSRRLRELSQFLEEESRRLTKAHGEKAKDELRFDSAAAF